MGVCVCDIKIRVPVKNHTVSDLSKLDALLHKTYIKVLLVLWYQGSTCVDPYYHYVKQHIDCGVITHSAKETGQQKEQWGVGNTVGVFIKQEGQHSSTNYVKRLWKISHSPIKNQPLHSWLAPTFGKSHPLYERGGGGGWRRTIQCLLKISRSLWFSDVFQEVQKKTSAMKCVKDI